MAQNIKPGSRINIKIVKFPTNKAAVKTLTRLLSKDAAVVADNARLLDIRRKQNEPRARSGRSWVVRLVKQRPVKGQVGESGTITATLDVIRDLGSVQRFVEVTAA